MKAFDVIISFSLIVLCSLFGYFFYACFQNFVYIQESLHQLEYQVNQAENKLLQAGISLDPSVPCATAVSSQLWEKLQKNLQNTVVQLIVTKNEVNVLQPFKVPKQGQDLGSGFIINSDGEIITNAHVVNGAISIMAQMPSFGKHQFEVDLVGIMPEKDVALLKFKQEDIVMICQSLGSLSYLQLGDSDAVHRSQEILALGYPLGQQSLKSTTGVISGRETGMIQMSAPINPGSSGGPSLNCLGQVIGINTAGIMAAQNVGYIIPINDLKIFLNDLRAGGLVRKPYIGVYQSMATAELLKALNNPLPGGTYVVDVMKDSPLFGQLKTGDMIYEINGLPVDLYGDVTVPWSEDKISTAEYISRLNVGEKVKLLVYRKGKKMNFECTFDRKKLLPIRQMYPEYEELPYEVFGGYVIMPLMLNHVPLLLQTSSSLAKYGEDKNQDKELLIITHVIPDSPAYRARLRLIGSILKKVNDVEVKTLADLQKALQKSKEIITIETEENILVALDTQKVLKAEKVLAQKHGYAITPGMQQLLEKHSHGK
ncbi:trypsin-like peptidase domain-containing protein [Candidatus Babeliales bacterium]|nr:trypsin-like peptidase domain-containing protein [Candidatus Babeliales bacterium]